MMSWVQSFYMKVLVCPDAIKVLIARLIADIRNINISQNSSDLGASQKRLGCPIEWNVKSLDLRIWDHSSQELQ